MTVRRIETGDKGKSITLLCLYDPDFAFEYACLGVNEIV